MDRLARPHPRPAVARLRRVLPSRVKHVAAAAFRCAAVVAAVAVLAGPVVAAGWEWDGGGWADYRPYLGPINAAMQARLRAIAADGAARGRVVGRLGQIGDSITMDWDYFRNAEVFGVTVNETGHDYEPIRSWLAYAGAQPADALSFYSTYGKGTQYGNHGGWKVSSAIAAGHPTAGIEVGDENTPGEYGWVLVMLGTNDVNAEDWNVASWKQEMRGFLQGYVDLGVIPVVSSIPPQAGTLGAGRVAAANEAVMALAVELGIPWVDYHGLVMHFQPWEWHGSLISDDGLHPTGATGGREFSIDAQTITDGYALRTKLTFDMAEKLRAIVFGDATPDCVDPVPPVVSITSPAGGESFIANLPHTIRWGASDSAGVVAVDIDLSTDGGATYSTAIARCVPNTGSYAWTVPGTASTTVRVRVTAYDANYNATSASSDSDFSVIQVLSAPLASTDAPGIALRPNPLRDAGARDAGTIELSLPGPATVRVDLVDVAGREVQRLAAGALAAGRHVFRWDGRVNGAPAPAGLYFVRVTGGGRVVSRRWVVTR